MSLLEGLTQQLGGQVLSNIAQQLGSNESQTQTAISAALPLLITALAKNSAEPSGANALANALDKDHDGSVLGDLMGLISNPQASSGAGILRHLLGGKQDLAQQGISQTSGLSGGQAGQLLMTLAPIVMGFLGKQKQQTGMNPLDLAGFLGNQQQVAQSQAGGMSSLLNLLDFDHDGSPIDDVLGMLGKFMK